MVRLAAVARMAEGKGFDPLVPVSLLTPSVSTAVARTIQHAMSISVEERFSTVKEFWQEFTTYAAQPAPYELDMFMPRTEMTMFKTPQSLATVEQKLMPEAQRSLPGTSYGHTSPVMK